MDYLASVLKIFSTFAAVFLLLTLTVNFLVNRFPRLPGDFDLRSPFPLYLPFTSAIVLTVLLVVLFNSFFR